VPPLAYGTVDIVSSNEVVRAILAKGECHLRLDIADVVVSIARLSAGASIAVLDRRLSVETSHEVY